MVAIMIAIFIFNQLIAEFIISGSNTNIKIALGL